MTSKTALIIGASRGLGLGLVAEYLARGWNVVATIRGLEAPAGLRALQSERLEIEQLDINDPDGLSALASRLSGRTFEVLFVNAGVANDPGEHVGMVSTEEFVRIMTTNALSPMRVVETLHHCVTPTGCVALMSSGLGSVANNTTGGWEVYRASKAALNTLVRSYAARHAHSEQSFLAIAPGWVRTDMGGPGASLDVETSIRGVVDAIEAQQGRPGGQFLNYLGATVPW